MGRRLTSLIQELTMLEKMARAMAWAAVSQDAGCEGGPDAPT